MTSGPALPSRAGLPGAGMPASRGGVRRATSCEMSAAAQVRPPPRQPGQNRRARGTPGRGEPGRAGLGGAWMGLCYRVLALISLSLGVFELRPAGACGILEFDDGVWFGAAVRLAGRGALRTADLSSTSHPGCPAPLSRGSAVPRFRHRRSPGRRPLRDRPGRGGQRGPGRLTLRHRSVLCVVVAVCFLPPRPSARLRCGLLPAPIC